MTVYLETSFLFDILETVSKAGISTKTGERSYSSPDILVKGLDIEIDFFETIKIQSRDLSSDISFKVSIPVCKKHHPESVTNYEENNQYFSHLLQ